VLSEEERDEVGTYLNQKYGFIADAPMFGHGTGSSRDGDCFEPRSSRSGQRRAQGDGARVRDGAGRRQHR
jgi:hypothetical protein